MRKRTIAILLSMALLISICASAAAVERYQVLMFGDNDQYVKEAQAALYSLGLLKSKPTGYFGNETLAAVKAFQKKKNITADGIIGLGTRKLLLPNAKPIPSTRVVATSASPEPTFEPITPTPTPTPSVTTDPNATIDPNATPTPTPSASAALGTTPVATGVVTAKTSLTFRSGPSKTSSSLGEIPRASEVAIYASKGEYYRIAYKNKQGYVLKAYINVLPKAVVKAEVVVNKLNLRSTPSEKGTIIQSFKKGEVLNVISQADAWYKVAYLDKIGYCIKTSVKIQTATASPTFDPAKSYVKATNLNLRTSADSGASVVTRLPQFTPVTILEDLGTWLKVQALGKTGYVMSEFIIRGQE